MSDYSRVVASVNGGPELEIEQNVENEGNNDGVLGGVLDEPEEFEIEAVGQLLDRALAEQMADQWEI
jgi:hypothetical protein